MNVCVRFMPGAGKTMPEAAASWNEEERRAWTDSAGAWTRYLPLGSRFLDETDAAKSGLACSGGTVTARKLTSDGMRSMKLAPTSHYAAPQADTILINSEHWDRGSSAQDGLNLSQYRDYVVRHNLGHLFGFDHDACSARGIMTQQQSSDADEKCAVSHLIDDEALRRVRCLDEGATSGRMRDVCRDDARRQDRQGAGVHFWPFT